ncbi:hypothetical protein GCM10007874_45790 [Labrys miyagiensis]|uniref:Uncharacterized protein n=1 Tax=Labrys miyagiensis TaxID=346912 RepID=A0ABQ6CPN4_9HYPH|nr:hypothetical protein [Labrys miyagiensis]GLS21562.1 hypothetical protein GCM10007874_45790 [Labrys miyagiensis]
MNDQAFKVGDIVLHSAIPWQRDEGAYEIVRLMPADNPEPTYRLRNVADSRERIARQHELRRQDGEITTKAATL